MSYAIKDIKTINKDTLTLGDVNYIYQNCGFYAVCYAGKLLGFLEENGGL